uniref:WW domain-containing protein n=1 Tax=Glossina palpalis gambiensis TaxID=67801 RepID=A0A1B0C543_9MUSC
MSDSSGRQYQKLPPGWDCKFDQATGNCYYINYFTKAIQLEDPRPPYRQLQNERCSSESIPMQGPGGSPYHVYPTNNIQAMRAFQTSTPNRHLPSSSRFALDTSPLPILKNNPTQTPRIMANMSRRSTIQETSFSNQIDTNAVVHKIQNMFPTASENHIRLLLKKYYNRENIVISALQVEKYPLTMPGPFVTPPAQRHLFHSNSAVYMTPPVRRTGREPIQFVGNYSRTASPAPTGRLGSVISVSSGGGSKFGHVALPIAAPQDSPKVGDHLMRNSPKPQHSSPKMKLRYMKTIFPKADETLLLDILANADNNVQKASEKLISLGYTKRDFAPPPKVMNRYVDVEKQIGKQADELVKIIPLRPREYSESEKDKMKERLSKRYPQIAERILLMALESVNYAEDRAIQILQIVQEEEAERQFVKVKKESSILTLKKTTKEDDDIENQLTCKTDDKSISSTVDVTDLKDRNESTSTNSSNNFSIINSSSFSLISSASSSIMPTKSILDRYRTNINRINISEYLRYPCSANTLWKQLPSLARVKFEKTMKNSQLCNSDGSMNDLCIKFESLLERTTANGPNRSLPKGANENLLLADYVTWNGANPDFQHGQRNVANGSDFSLRTERNYKPCGHNSELRKGPRRGLAKGSLYTAQNAASSKTIDIKCN